MGLWVVNENDLQPRLHINHNSQTSVNTVIIYLYFQLAFQFLLLLLGAAFTWLQSNI
jgi:hypothetical protein